MKGLNQALRVSRKRGYQRDTSLYTKRRITFVQFALVPSLDALFSSSGSIVYGFDRADPRFTLKEKLME